MPSWRVYLEKVVFLAILILIYIKAYLVYPDILIKQAVLFSIFFAFFQYVGAGLIFAKMMKMNWVDTLFYTQLSVVLALLAHYCIDHTKITHNTNILLYVTVYIIALPSLSAYANYLATKYMK